MLNTYESKNKDKAAGNMHFQDISIYRQGRTKNQ